MSKIFPHASVIMAIITVFLSFGIPSNNCQNSNFTKASIPETHYSYSDGNIGIVDVNDIDEDILSELYALEALGWDEDDTIDIDVDELTEPLLDEETFSEYTDSLSFQISKTYVANVSRDQQILTIPINIKNHDIIIEHPTTPLDETMTMTVSTCIGVVQLSKKSDTESRYNWTKDIDEIQSFDTCDITVEVLDMNEDILANTTITLNVYDFSSGFDVSSVYIINEEYDPLLPLEITNHIITTPLGNVIDGPIAQGIIHYIYFLYNGDLSEDWEIYINDSCANTYSTPTIINNGVIGALWDTVSTDYETICIISVTLTNTLTAETTDYTYDITVQPY